MERKFNRILVGFDNSESAKVAIEIAIDIAVRFESKMYAIYVHRSDEQLAEVQGYIEKVSKRRNVQIDPLAMGRGGSMASMTSSIASTRSSGSSLAHISVGIHSPVRQLDLLIEPANPHLSLVVSPSHSHDQ